MVLFLKENPALSVAVKTCKNSTSDSVREKFLQEACKFLLCVFLRSCLPHLLTYKNLQNLTFITVLTCRLTFFFPCSDHASVWPPPHCKADGSHHRESSLDHHGALHTWRGGTQIRVYSNIHTVGGVGFLDKHILRPFKAFVYFSSHSSSLLFSGCLFYRILSYFCYLFLSICYCLTISLHIPSA